MTDEQPPPVSRLRRLWLEAFENQPATLFELLLFVLLLDSMRDSLAVLRGGQAAFHQVDAFQEAALGIRPVAWTAWLPVAWVLSWPVWCAAALANLVAATLWLLKRCLPWAPLVCVLAHGMRVSLFESTIFNYTHRPLPSVAVLIIFAGFYWFRHRDIERAIGNRDLWTLRLYPRWVFVLVVAYLGFQYTYSGLTKLVLGGGQAGSGLSMQLLVSASLGVDRGASVPWIAEPLLRSRAIAGLAMTSAVVLEIGAALAFAVRRVRPWWALGLLVMHCLVIVTLHIPFIAHIVLLAWIALAAIAEPLERIRASRLELTVSPALKTGVAGWLLDAAYRMAIPGALFSRSTLARAP